MPFSFTFFLGIKITKNEKNNNNNKKRDKGEPSPGCSRWYEE